MKRYSAAVLLAMLVIANVAHGQVWLQSGASGGDNSASNYGASVSIQTIYQNISDGSLGFWIGENLANDAFVQVGYEIVNQSAYYPTYCSPSSCSGKTYINAGVPTWFWEYFPSGSDESTFYGGIGGDGTARNNGTFNTYAFKSNGNTWNFYFDNKQIGSANLGTSSSGQNAPSIIAEVAQTQTDSFVMKVVRFKDATFYNGNSFVQIPSAYSQIGYGIGSEKTLPNVYGVQEVDHNVNYFEVGSGLPTQSETMLWQLGYSLAIVSQYANLTGSGNYSAYVPVTLHAPSAINTSAHVREILVGWKGIGIGSYTGNATNATVIMDGNITETALWQRQYYLNVNDQYNDTSGAGWYNANSTATLRVENTPINISNGTRLAFEGWGNGTHTNPTRVLMDAPRSIAVQWGTQYFIAAYSSYGNTTGTGWYDQNSRANLSIKGIYAPTGDLSRLAFTGWSNGNSSAKTFVVADRPMTISAQFGQQYMVRFVAEDAYGNSINVEYYNISGNKIVNDSLFLFANKKYNVEYMYYKNTIVAMNYALDVNAPETIGIKTPVYDVVISTMSVFRTPVNATVNATFKNGTKVVMYTGKNGHLALQDIPYGYVKGYVKYFGLTESINTVEGSDAYLTLITPSLIAAILAGIAIIALAFRSLNARYRTVKYTQ